MKKSKQAQTRRFEPSQWTRIIAPVKKVRVKEAKR